jgi:hypothetical protein
MASQVTAVPKYGGNLVGIAECTPKKVAVVERQLIDSSANTDWVALPLPEP